jgi:hypothetical protein
VLRIRTCSFRSLRPHLLGMAMLRACRTAGHVSHKLAMSVTTLPSALLRFVRIVYGTHIMARKPLARRSPAAWRHRRGHAVASRRRSVYMHVRMCGRTGHVSRAAPLYSNPRPSAVNIPCFVHCQRVHPVHKIAVLVARTRFLSSTASSYGIQNNTMWRLPNYILIPSSGLNGNPRNHKGELLSARLAFLPP